VSSQSGRHKEKERKTASWVEAVGKKVVFLSRTEIKTGKERCSGVEVHEYFTQKMYRNKRVGEGHGFF
jgi:hypothetical protein